MPRRIVTVTGSSFRIEEYELAPLAPGEVRVRVEFAAPKHGTESHAIRGSAFDRKQWDSELRMFLPREESAVHAPPVPRPIGNTVVGTVTEVGTEVSAVRPGDRVFGYGPIREIHQAPAASLRPMGTLSEPDAVCVDPAHVAFVAVRDGNIRIGDSVAVFGCGAIGLLAVQIARTGGARKILAVDPIAIRRECAEKCGVDAAFDPVPLDVSLQIKRATGHRGVDVAIETSGSSRALHESIRCVQQCGTVVHVPWGPMDAAELHLDEEFHLNRPTLIGSQAWAGWGNPDRDYPLWDHERAFQATIDLFRDGILTGKDIVRPIVDFEDAPDALAAIFDRPESTIKIGVRFAP